MKIALVSPYDFSWPGGVVTHVTHLAREFMAMGHEVKVLAPLTSHSARPSSSPNLVPIGRSVPVPTGGSIARISVAFWLIPRIRALLDRESFDIIHLHEPLTPLLPLAVLSYSTAVNVGTFHAFHGNAKWYGFTKPVLNKWFKKLHGRIAVSPAAHQFVCKHFHGDYSIIPNGIDVDHFSSATVTPIPEFMDDKINILFVGRLEKRKGLRYLLDAYSQLKWNFPEVRLIVVGPGTPDKISYRILSERNLKDVVFMGGVPNNELPRYYKSAHIFCSPATGKESFGIVLLEAMSSGKPIVASRIEGYSFLVSHGHQGLLVSPKNSVALKDALALLVQDPDLRLQMGARGREAAEEYRWEVVASQVMDYYVSLTPRHALTATRTS